MMTVPMDSSAIPSSRELAQRLFKKNIELENGLRRSAQAKIPSDPNVWLQMRENYEAILLEDHDFSDKHEVEFILWQLHYRRIEEFRMYINAAKSSGLIETQGAQNSSRPDRIKKIRSAFKSFLSESTGFYHDLILKIRANYGFPLGFFSENPESQIISLKDENKIVERKKGLLSFHRCLIYLGDLARYKGMYGEGDSAIREFAAASSYYMQAASLCPSSGNPHHQLAILASYSNDDLVTIYRYFRSLSVDNPFSTAQDNLVIAFEKNRQRTADLISMKAATLNVLPQRSAGRGRGRGDARNFAKDNIMESAIKEHELSTPEIFKAFTVRFVRLHGILFTRTSLETFGDLLASVIRDLRELLGAGIEETFNFGADATENALIIVRLVSILIFTVYNVNRDTVDQSYAGILQRSVLLQSAFSASFEFVGHILKRCAELDDVASSFLLPGIMVFIEWLACQPDIAVGSDVKEKEISARTFFWDQCVLFMNALLSDRHGYIDTYEDETCFSNMSHYDEGETGNRLALWEDFELRGFLPLMQAHLILDFSRKHSIGGDGTYKERKARLQRIFAAGRALMNVVRIEQQGIFFDDLLKKFVFGIEPNAFVGDNHDGFTDVSELNVSEHTSSVETMSNLGGSLSSMIDYGVAPVKAVLHLDGEDEDEEIVFKPTVTEKFQNFIDSMPPYQTVQPVHVSSVSSVASWDRGNGIPPYQTVQPVHVSSVSSVAGWDGGNGMPPYQTVQPVHVSSVSSVAGWDGGNGMPHSSFTNNQLSNGMNGTSQMRTSSPTMLTDQDLSHVSTTEWLMEKEAILLEGLKNMNIENDFMHQGGLSAFHPTASAPPASVSTNSFFSNQVNFTDTIIPSPLDSIVLPVSISTTLPTKSSSALPTATKKNPVSRPVRHFGPPPGFNHTSSAVQSSPLYNLDLDQQLHVDDYSWLDDYQSSSTTKTVEPSVNHTFGMHHLYFSDNSSAFNGITSLPFFEKQVPLMPKDAVNEKWQDFQLFEHLKPFADKHISFTNMKPSIVPEQHHAQSMWSGNYFV